MQQDGLGLMVQGLHGRQSAEQDGETLSRPHLAEARSKAGRLVGEGAYAGGRCAGAAHALRMNGGAAQRFGLQGAGDAWRTEPHGKLFGAAAPC